VCPAPPSGAAIHQGSRAEKPGCVIPNKSRGDFARRYRWDEVRHRPFFTGRGNAVWLGVNNFGPGALGAVSRS
jgi:hypothetical protein